MDFVRLLLANEEDLEIVMELRGPDLLQNKRRRKRPRDVRRISE